MQSCVAKQKSNLPPPLTLKALSPGRLQWTAVLQHPSGILLPFIKRLENKPNQRVLCGDVTANLP